MLKPSISGICKLEKDFQSKLTEAYKRMGCFVFKIPDNSMTAKPYDMILVDTFGSTYHIELKITKDLAINVSNLRPNQRASLGAISRLNQAAAWVFVYSKKDSQYYCMQYDEFRERANEVGTVKLFNSLIVV